MSELALAEQAFLETRGRELLRQIGLVGEARFQRLSGGRNNRVYLVEGVGHAVVMKWYFRHPQDQRDRLHVEYSFLQFAKTCGAECVAQPLARSDVDRLALYSRIDGRALAAGEVDRACVEQAVAFWRLFNANRDSEAAAQLPTASEACFSLQQHIDCITERVARLQKLPDNSPWHPAAARLVEDRLTPALRQATDALHRFASGVGLDLTEVLPIARCCISPSDFGFHNVLRRADGRLAFLDFEYAGWDDPAKSVCDFYCQPQVPVPRETWPLLAAATAEFAADPSRERQRQAALFPLYQIKWCCILLNEFLPAAEARREFAESQAIDLAEQLAKAQRLMNAIESCR